MSRIPLAPDKLLYSEVLCTRLSNKFKKIKVTLTQTGSSTVPVYILGIDGIGHRYHLNLEFTPRDLCFLHTDEHHEKGPEETGCLACLNRNYYPTTVFTRLTIIWYIDGKTGQEAQCVKVPLLQRGNVHATARLRKLQTLIHRLVHGEEYLRHWPVVVQSCGSLPQWERVHLALTQHALVVIKNFYIVYYYPLHSCSLHVTSGVSTNVLHVTVTELDLHQWDDDVLNEEEYRTWIYAFQTSYAEEIRNHALFLKDKSKKEFHKPSAHFNIRHSEFSASLSGHVPGTTSDNVIITPHFRQHHSGGSSSSNGHVLGTTSDNVHITLHSSPPPHLPSTNSSGIHANIHASLSDFGPRTTFPYPAPPPHLVKHSDSSNSNGHVPGSKPRDQSDSGEKLKPRGHQSEPFSSVKMKSLKVQKSGSSTEESQSGSGVSKDYLHAPDDALFGSDTSTATWPPSQSRVIREINKPDHLSVEADLFEVGMDVDVPEDFSFLDDENIASLPPAPCGMVPHPLQDISSVLHESSRAAVTVSRQPVIRPRVPTRQLLRSQSTRILNDSEMASHTYCNVEQAFVQMRNVHEDNPYVYYRFYYNIGFIKCAVQRATMRKKLKRRSRLSELMENIDFNVLEKHEKWYDQCFKSRDKDLRFLRIHQPNLPVEGTEDESSNAYSSAMKPEGTPDDPYWNSDLCLTLQAKLQGEIPSASQVFDLSQEQFVSMNVLLSLVPAEHNWKYLAELIGLMYEDLTIIEHFCYTYREMAAEVVFAHWILQEKRSKAQFPCTHERLMSIMEDFGREDIKHLLHGKNVNEGIQTEEDLNLITHF